MRISMKLFWLCILLVQLVGCRGCKQQQKPNETPEEAEIRKKKQRLVGDELRALPYAKDIPGNFLKPGHWYEANHRLKANFADESLTVTLSVVNREKKSVPFATNQVPVEFNRNLSLALGQEKNIQLKFFQPEVGVSGTDSESEQAASTLVAMYAQRGIGTPVLGEAFPNRLLMGYQYNLVTLSRDPSRFIFWRGLDCIVWPSKAKMAEERIAPHRVIDLKEDEIGTQFPSHLYAMTSVSHLVVNDMSLSILSTEQQQAVQDWLRFGGTIILNGPEAIGGVPSSFLKELVPLENTSTVEISAEDIAMLNGTWTIRQAQGGAQPFVAEGPVTKLAGTLTEGAQWVRFEDSSQRVQSLTGLVVERLVGQGRVVMTTFPMSDNSFLKWPSYSSFVHNVILRKPHRDTTLGSEADTRFAGGYESTEHNPIHSTRMRLWARDLDSTTSRSTSELPKDVEIMDFAATFKNAKRSSFGAWNPESVVVQKARQALQESSGITVPKINTIIKLLLGYLVVLVPVNWLVFRLMGRVELAWAAAPFIAIAGAFVVASSVQLDIGFSRSQTSYGFLECHQGYSRGVMSNYTALYSSLSTNYRTVFEKDNGIVLPLPSGGTGANVKRPRGNIRKVDYWYADESGAGMQSTPVLSNTTGLFQSEEMLDIGGTVTAKFADNLREVECISDLPFSLQDVGVVGVDSEGRLLTGWLGNIEAGSRITARLETPEKDIRWRNEWDSKPILAKPRLIRADDSKWSENDLGSELYLGPLIEEVTQSYPLGRGEFIAVGWSDNSMASLQITPVAKQKKDRTVVLLHLRTAELQASRPDVRIFPKTVDEPAE